MTRTIGALALAIFVGCGGDDGGGGNPDAGTPDAAGGCQPATVLPTAYRPIPEVSAGAVNVTSGGGITSGTIDATAGGMNMSADNPYIYVDLRGGGMKIAVDDIAALTSMDWDIALKRASLRSNGGDSGVGARRVAVVPAADLAAVTMAPTSGYGTDDFATDDCMYASIPGGEPMSAFGEWYDYDDVNHVVSPKAEVYVVERGDGTHTAFRVVDYYGDVSMPMRGAFYQVEWKDL
jgi:hypothetical protein